MVGTTITHYRIVGEIGRGGMGVVYAAEDTRLGRRVAIKMLGRDVTGDADRLARFVREAQATSAINHPNIATIYEIDEADGLTFIAMEFVEGRTLRALVDAGVPPGDVVGLGLQIATGLAKAHELGIVHRDVKPENVIVRPDGIVKILDFGLAKLIEAPEAGDTTGAMTITAPGLVLGTARYMSPEQAQGRPVDARTDVFSVGAVLYEMASGKPAFPGGSRLDVLYAVATRPPDALPDDGRLPPGFTAVVARALAKSPDDRFRDCGALAAALRDCGTGDGGAAAGPGALSGRSWATATGAVAAAAPAAASAGPRHAIAVLPLRSVSGAPDADWMQAGLQIMLSSELARVPAVRVVSPDRLNAVLGDLRLPAGAVLDAATARSLSEHLSADTVVSGSFVKLGPASRIDLVVTQIGSGAESPVRFESKDDAELLTAVSHLAAEILRVIEVGAERDLVTTMVGETGSRDPESVKAYVDGLAKLYQGNNAEAAGLLARATERDPAFAMAYTYLGAALSNMGRDDDAAAALATAVGLSRSLPRADRLFVTARQALAAGEATRAIEALEQLTALLPNNLGAFYELALACELEGDWDKAVANLERVAEMDPRFAAAVFALGRVSIKKGDCEKALEHLHRALSLHVLSGNREGEATVLNAIGLAHFWLDRHEDALKRYEESLAIKRDIGDTRGTSATLSNMAVVYQVRGEYDRATATYLEALALSESLGDKQGVAENSINLGTVYEEQGRLDDALAAYKKALEFEPELGDRMAEILCLNNIGNVYLTQGRLDDAEVYIARALDARRELGERKGIAISLNYVGNIARLRGQYDRALARYLEALEIFREIKWPSGEAETLAYMAAVMAARGRHVAALESLEVAGRIYADLGDQCGSAVVLAARAAAECALGACETAPETSARAVAAAGEVGNSDMRASALLVRARVRRLAGDAAGALADLEAARSAAEACGARVTALRVEVETARARATADVGRKGAEAVRTRAEEAVRLASAAVEDAGARRLGSLLADAHLAHAESLLAAGRPREAAEAAARAAERAEAGGEREVLLLAHCAAARALTALGDARARAHAGPAREVADALAAEQGPAGARYLARPDIAAALEAAVRG
jgi:tetratricopeptide (TPR) repeat protein/TolB-like protein/predicted Ser/Thr protein kinase